MASIKSEHNINKTIQDGSNIEIQEGTKALSLKVERTTLSGVETRISGIDNLPNSLEVLVFGKYFNQPIDNLPCGASAPNAKLGAIARNLPMNLKSLVLGEFFNQSLDNLPEGLIKLIIDSYQNKFNKSFDMLPKSLKYLQIIGTFNNDIRFLPESLEHLIMYGIFNNDVITFPDNIQTLEITFQSNYIGKKEITLEKLPKNLIYFKTGGCFNTKGKFKCPNLKTVDMEQFCNVINFLPEGVEEVKLCCNYNKHFKYLPKSVKKLTLTKSNYHYNLIKITEYLPNLKELTVSKNYIGIIDNNEQLKVIRK